MTITLKTIKPVITCADPADGCKFICFIPWDQRIDPNNNAFDNGFGDTYEEAYAMWVETMDTDIVGPLLDKYPELRPLYERIKKMDEEIDQEISDVFYCEALYTDQERRTHTER